MMPIQQAGGMFQMVPMPYGAAVGRAVTVPSLPVVKLRGLPFRCEEADVYDFFAGLEVLDVLFVRKEKRFTGEAFVLLGSSMHADLALQRNRMHLGSRYIEVFKSRKAEYYNAVAHEVEEEGGLYPDEQKGAMGGGAGYGGGGYGAGQYGAGRASSSFEPPPGTAPVGGGLPSRIPGGVPQAPPSSLAQDGVHTGVLRLRGLPFSATVQDIVDFFAGFPVSPDAVHIVTNASGRSTGEAFVEFPTAKDSQQAMLKDRASMGRRYIELYPSSREEATSTAARASTKA